VERKGDQRKRSGWRDKGFILTIKRQWLQGTPVERELKKGDVVIEVDPRYFRPTEVDLLLGDASKARQKLGWKPRCIFSELVREMVQS
jgi:GDPmannose 4,6-dehydratase